MELEMLKKKIVLYTLFRINSLKLLTYEKIFLIVDSEIAGSVYTDSFKYVQIFQEVQHTFIIIYLSAKVKT